MGNAEQAEKVVAYLNDLLHRDPAAMSALIGNRVPCTADIVQHPSCQVWQVNHNSWTVGFLGVLNGLLHTIDVEQVAIVYEPSNPNFAVRFELLDVGSRPVHNAKNQRRGSPPEETGRTPEGFEGES